jgi:hypothetical protein
MHCEKEGLSTDKFGKAKEITEIGYVTVTFQENTSDAGLAGVYDKVRANECSDIPGDQ